MLRFALVLVPEYTGGGEVDYMKVFDQALAVSTSGYLKEVSELEVPSIGSAVGN